MQVHVNGEAREVASPATVTSLLESMKIVDPFGQPGYEPMRGVNGELDNVYDPTAEPIALQP